METWLKRLLRKTKTDDGDILLLYISRRNMDPTFKVDNNVL